MKYRVAAGNEKVGKTAELPTHLPTLPDNVDYFVKRHLDQTVMTFGEDITVFATLVATVGYMKLKAKEIDEVALLRFFFTYPQRIHASKFYLLPQDEVILLPQEPVFVPQEAFLVPHDETLLPHEATLLPQPEATD